MKALTTTLTLIALATPVIEQMQLEWEKIPAPTTFQMYNCPDGNILIYGRTQDLDHYHPLLSKFDREGNHVAGISIYYLYNGSLNDVCQDTAGNVYALASIYGIAKFSPVFEWEWYIEEPGYSARRCVTGPDDALYVFGTSLLGNHILVLTKYDTDGNMLWQVENELDSTYIQDISIYADVVIDEDEGVYISCTGINTEYPWLLRSYRAKYRQGHLIYSVPSE